MIAIGCDHGGFNLKEAIKKYLDEKKVPYKDFGTADCNSVDYPYYAYRVANEISNGNCTKGVLCCGTGIGIAIAANKIKGIRAAVCDDEFTTEMARKHNDANILCLGGRVIDEKKAVLLMDIFLNTSFDGGRHNKRIEQISQIENGIFKIN